MGDEMRDPRRDPRPGDILRKKYQGQYFESRGYLDRRVTYGLNPNDGRMAKVRFTLGITDDRCLLSTWRRWAATAEVVERGEAFERGELGDGTHRMTDDGLAVLGTQDACKEAALESGFLQPEPTA